MLLRGVDSASVNTPMLRHCCSIAQVELGKIDAVGVQRKAQKVPPPPPPPAPPGSPPANHADNPTPERSVSISCDLRTDGLVYLQLQEQAARITAELDAALGRPSDPPLSTSAPAAAADGNNGASTARPAGRQPIAAMSAEVGRLLESRRSHSSVFFVLQYRAPAGCN